MLLTNAKIATLSTGRDYDLIDAGTIVVERQKIQWVGPADELPEHYSDLPAKSLSGRLVTPGLIDCHSHIIFGGNRALEFEMRLKGASYSEIARNGGGINSTVQATRKADDASLLESALTRVDAMIAEGVTTLEIKSGYGLDIDTELKMLRVARKIAELRPIEVCTSFLGAHAIPPEYTGNADSYIDDICIPALRQAHAEGLVDAVDGFCEGIAFNPSQISRVFDAAGEFGLPIKLHAEQLTHSGGTRLAARYKALSVDHVEYALPDDAAALAKSETVAVLLPGAFYTLRETQVPPIQSFRENKVSIALATDCNPGSSPLTSLLLAMNMGCTLFGLTPVEALLGVTTNAAKALGLADRGRVVPGMRADLCVWDADHPAELSYRIGFNPLISRLFGGEE